MSGLQSGHKCDEAANLPIKDLGDKAPESDRPWVEPKQPALGMSCVDGKRDWLR